MYLAAYEFEHICRIVAEVNAEGLIRIEMPQVRYAKRYTVPLHRYGNGPFCKFKVPNSHKRAGVYALAAAEQILYIGECENRSSRFNAGYGNISPKNCFAGGQQPNCRLNNLIYQVSSEGGSIMLWFHPTSEYKRVELELRELLRPPWNRR